MDKKERLNEINKELKIDINESSFISQKCRNQLLKIFAEEFGVSLDIDSYKNVDLSIQEDYTILYREDSYTPNPKITSMEELEEKYHAYQEKSDEILKNKQINFQEKRRWNDIWNLIIVFFLLLLAIGVVLLAIFAFLSGRYIDCLWLVVFIFPSLIPKLKESILERIDQAKVCIKTFFKKKR